MSAASNEVASSAGDSTLLSSNLNETIVNEDGQSSSNDNTQNGCLFVGDLSIFCTEADMLQAFQPFGEIVEVKVMRCDETHKNLCYGFVKYESMEDAQKAMDSLKSALLCGRPMRISWASHRTREKRASGDQNTHTQFMSTSSVHVSYSANQIEKIITEEILRNVFGEYGSIHDITIKKFEVDEKAKVQRGYGFVHFPASQEGVNAALKCAEELKDKAIDGIHYKCDISHKLLRQLNINHPSQSERTSHKHHINSYQKQGKHVASANQSQFQSQSSELTDFATPSIDLSSMSFESTASMNSHFTQAVHPSAYFMVHPSVMNSTGSMPTMVQPQMSHGHAPPPTQQSSSSFIYPHIPESLYVDVHQAQSPAIISQQQNPSPHMMYQTVPGAITTPHTGYVYYPSPSTTPTAHYLRSLNPSGKAPFSSSTTTAMMGGDMKLSHSSSSSNPTTPTASQHHPQHSTHRPKAKITSASISGSLDLGKSRSPLPSLAVENVSSAVVSPPISPQPRTTPAQGVHFPNESPAMMQMNTNMTPAPSFQQLSHPQWHQAQAYNNASSQQMNTRKGISQSVTGHAGSSQQVSTVQSSPVQSMLPPPIYVPPMMQMSMPPSVPVVQHTMYSYPQAPMPGSFSHQSQQQSMIMNNRDYFMSNQVPLENQALPSSAALTNISADPIRTSTSAHVQGQPVPAVNNHIIYSNLPHLAQSGYSYTIPHTAVQHHMLPSVQPITAHPQQPHQPQQMYFSHQQVYPNRQNSS